jgi:outer membrane protein assembly factor BamA
VLTEFSIDSIQVSISPDKKDMYLAVSLHEGEPYRSPIDILPITHLC